MHCALIIKAIAMQMVIIGSIDGHSNCSMADEKLIIDKGTSKFQITFCQTQIPMNDNKYEILCLLDDKISVCSCWKVIV